MCLPQAYLLDNSYCLLRHNVTSQSGSRATAYPYQDNTQHCIVPVSWFPPLPNSPHTILYIQLAVSSLRVGTLLVILPEYHAAIQLSAERSSLLGSVRKGLGFILGLRLQWKSKMKLLLIDMKHETWNMSRGGGLGRNREGSKFGFRHKGSINRQDAVVEISLFISTAYCREATELGVRAQCLVMSIATVCC